VPRFSLRGYLRTTFGWDDPTRHRLCGMDEVGRGSFAGPLVAAAVVLPPRFRHPLLRDSKLLSARQRETAETAIRRSAVSIAVEEISADDINHRGLGWANTEIFRRLASAVDADGYCCDGRLRIGGDRTVHCLVDGDALVPAVAAASIVAKVHRDAIMTAFHRDAPVYCWDRNKGYGAPEHRAAIRAHGTHPQHRQVFIRNLLQLGLFDEDGLDFEDGAPSVAALAG
jgi:ribonuclease HII